MRPDRRFFLISLVAAAVTVLPAGQSDPAASSAVQLIWHDPGPVEQLDFAGGPGGRAGAPRPPFHFIEEDSSGTSPKVKVKDAQGATWSVKWGDEVHSDTFASRMAWAAGYFVQPVHFIARGSIIGAKDLKRAKDMIGKDGTFYNARFQLRDPRIKFLDKDNWTWSLNPFVGTRELNGLKIVMMLTSNWDNKDARDVDRGSNTGILQDNIEGRDRLRYIVADWGGSMGRWGGVVSREKWDCRGYADQTPDFIQKVEHDKVKWGYRGQRTSDATDDIRISDLRWILQYVGRITDSQIRTGLRASGATPAEVKVFTTAIRARINQMRAAANPRGQLKAEIDPHR